MEVVASGGEGGWGGGVGGWGGGFFFFKQKTAYEMCGRDWSSDVCSSDLPLSLPPYLSLSAVLAHAYWPDSTAI